MSQDAKPTHAAVEGPDATLESVRPPEAAPAQEEAAPIDPAELPVPPEPQPEAEAALVAELRAEIAALEARLDAEKRDAREREKDLSEKVQRLAADFDNFRRRAREDAAAATSRGKEQLLKALLPVLDNLDLALAHANDEGLRLLARHFSDTLNGQGIVVLNPEGEAFDAKLHEAIGKESREGVDAGVVVTVAQKGYAFEGRVLRPARVIVSG